MPGGGIIRQTIPHTQKRRYVTRETLHPSRCNFPDSEVSPHLRGNHGRACQVRMYCFSYFVQLGSSAHSLASTPGTVISVPLALCI